jgi:hypothetical protein
MILAYLPSVSAHCSRVVPCLTWPLGMHPAPPKAKITNETVAPVTWVQHGEAIAFPPLAMACALGT